MKHVHPHGDSSQCEICRNCIPFEIPQPLYESLLKREVVLFAGAGISTENRRVLPYTLYEDICNELSISPARGPEFPELMTQYVTHAGGRARLLQKIKERFDYIHSFASLEEAATTFHKELSTIPLLDRIITTNWDNYFEQCCEATPFVSPQDFIFWNLPGRRVLKIHGSVSSFGSIVATKEDYGRCYRSLSRGLLGSSLKLELATKTILYIGFSFSDPDFQRIHRILTAELRGNRLESYVVSLDRGSTDRFKNEGLNPITTDGTFFLAKLKERLVREEHMIADQRFEGVATFLAKVQKEHRKVANTIDAAEFPDVIYTLSYQDGLQDALNRILRRKKTGEYSDPNKAHSVAWTYHNAVRPKKLGSGRFENVAYIDGYADGHIFLSVPDDARRGAPIHYVYGNDESIRSIAHLKMLLRRSSNRRSKAHLHAQRLVAKARIGSGMVFQHLTALF